MLSVAAIITLDTNMDLKTLAGWRHKVHQLLLSMAVLFSHRPLRPHSSTLLSPHTQKGDRHTKSVLQAATFRVAHPAKGWEGKAAAFVGLPFDWWWSLGTTVEISAPVLRGGEERGLLLDYELSSGARACTRGSGFLLFCKKIKSRG